MEWEHHRIIAVQDHGNQWWIQTDDHYWWRILKQFLPDREPQVGDTYSNIRHPYDDEASMMEVVTCAIGERLLWDYRRTEEAHDANE